FNAGPEAEKYVGPESAGAAEELVGEGRNCKRKADLPALSKDLQRTEVGETCRQGRADAARALGQHQHQESKLSRRHVRGRTDWPRHRRHDAAGYDRRIS